MLFFLVMSFFLATSDSHGTLYLTFGYIGMHSAAASMWALTKISYSSFEVCVSDISRIRIVSYSYCIFIVYISVSK